MRIQPGSASRRIQVLAIIHEHGPLSLRTLQKIVTPAISLRRLQETTKRLCERGLLVRHIESLSRKGEYVYQLGRSVSARNKICSLLHVERKELEQVTGRGKELAHTEQCALWAELFKLVFPEAKVIRDLAICRNLKAKDDFTPEKYSLDLVPDILLEFPKQPGLEKVMLGIEIERTLKSKVRLADKLRRLVTRTQLDGVLYICEGGEIETAVQSIFLGQNHKKSRRIGQYANNFLLFFNRSVDKVSSLDCLNAESKVVALRKWVTVCRSTPLHQRRETQFYFPASPRWEIGEEF